MLSLADGWRLMRPTDRGEQLAPVPQLPLEDVPRHSEGAPRCAVCCFIDSDVLASGPVQVPVKRPVGK